MKKLRYVKDLIGKYKYSYIGGIICLIIVDCLQLALPMVLGLITDNLKAGTLSENSLRRFAIIIAAIAAGIATFRFFWRYLVFGVSRVIETALRNRFYAHLQNLSANYYNNHKTGDLMAHDTNDINNIRMALGQGVALAIDSALIPVVAAVMMFSTAGARLTLVCFIPLLALAGIITFNVNFMHDSIQKMQEAFSELTETARENFSGIRVVKSFVQEDREIEKFRRANIYNRETNMKFVRNMSLLFPMIMSVSALSFALALLYGGSLVIGGELTLGSFVAFNGYLLMLIWPIAALGWISSIFQRGIVSLERVNAILDEEPEISDSQNTVNKALIEGEIVFKNLSFAYPGSDRPVLKNIDITVEKGKTLAVVGRTGSGKTTLINLISRQFNVEEGTLLIDGTDVNRIPLSVLRRNISYVPQDSFLFSSTIRENIDFFRGEDKESILTAARIAKIYDDVMDFPEKFETIVGERGVTLSGGQKQRIAIARAILAEPAVLILDDCLSAVDTNTEEEILKGLRQVMKQRTSIIVSHRISTIKDADEIIVLDDGVIRERGTHESLLQLQGLYHDIYHKQLLAEQIEEVE